MVSRESRQIQNFRGSLLRSINRKVFQTLQEPDSLVKADALAAAGHQQCIANFIEPEEWNGGTSFGERVKHGETVLSICFVFQKPLERE
jgi:hypothetical protein